MGSVANTTLMARYNQWMSQQQYLAAAALDDLILRWWHQVIEADLAVDLVYVNTRGQQYCDNFGALVQYFYNHQTHHRGQLSTLLSPLNIKLDSTDLLSVIRT
jgi:uncharacterized damage-inducible protein DinB